VSRELKERAASGRLEGMEAVAASISAWVSYEKRVKEAPEWPYTAGIIGRLAMSASVPGVAYLAKMLFRNVNLFIGP